MTHSIRLKIIAASSTLVVLCAAAFLVLSMWEHEKVYRTTVESSLQAISTNLAEDLVPMMATNLDHVAMTTRLLALETFPNINYAVIYDSSYQALEFYIAPERMKELETLAHFDSFNVRNLASGLTHLNTELVAVRRIGDENYVQGHLLVVVDYIGPLKRANRELLVNSLPLGTLILLVMLVSAAWMNRILLNPLAKLARFTQSIESSRSYHKRFDYAGHDIEVSHLSGNINAMLSRIEDQNSKSQEYTAKLEAQQNALTQLANYDTLTGLPNRKFFNETLASELHKAQRSGRDLLLMFLDLDHFKGINDSLGHEVGDALLIRVSDVIKEILRDGDVFCRLGGDEFTIIITEGGDDIVYTATSIAERIIQSLEEPQTIEEWNVQTGVSVGIADAKSANYSAPLLISNADLAMYRAKGGGRNRYSLFERQLQSDTVRKMHIANALTHALLNQEFVVYYQSKVDSQGHTNGFEALLRWNSSFDGFISPAEFIPIAEHSGRIPMITRWVIKQVFGDVQTLQSYFERPIKVSLNLSAHDIKEVGLIDYIHEQQRISGVLPAAIEFEVTESAYLDNLQEADKFFTSLRESGYSIALDDFGTGYSSLSYLTRIELDTLKIDQSFVKKMGDSLKDLVIVEAIVSLAHQLNINVCAEGVETEEQLELLSQLGIEQMQGYLFGKPAMLYEVVLLLPNRPIIELSKDLAPQRKMAGVAPNYWSDTSLRMGRQL